MLDFDTMLKLLLQLIMREMIKIESKSIISLFGLDDHTSIDHNEKS